MKPIATNNNSLQSQGIQKSVNFGIKSSGLHHILGILRNQLYSDKVLAVIREYTCNAHDAHIQGGCPDRAVEVTIPTKLSPIFKVRDFGPALSQNEIQEVYAFYGESTKRNTNDQIGMLGIGSKAAFAYGDNYVINSYLDGKKYIYNAFIDPSQIGQISKISEEDTNEENGIEIVVPVNEDDCREFEEKAKDLFKWFPVTPLIKGASQFEYDKTFLFQGDGWAWLKDGGERYNRGDATLVMGNIGYPVDTYALGDIDADDDLSRRIEQMLCSSLVVHMDIGDVEISASREKLQYTDYTKKNIKDKLKIVADALVSTISKQFKDCETLWDCKCLMGEVFDMGSQLYQLRDIVAKKMTFKGKKIGEARVSKWHGNDGDNIELRHWEKGYRSSRYSCKECNYIDARRDAVIIENDLGHRRGITGRILPLIYNKEQKPYLINFNSAKEKKSWIKTTGFDGKTVKLSSLPQHKLSEFSGYETSTGGSGYDKNEKHSAKCFELDFSADVARYHSKKSDHWKIADLDVKNESGVYVIIDKFQVEKPADGSSYATHVDPKQIKNLKEVTDQCGIKFPKNIYAFKVGQRKKIEGKDGWTELNTWAKEQIENIIEDNNLHQAWKDIQKVDELNEYRHDSDRYYGSKIKDQVDKLKKLELVDPNGTMGDFLAKHNQMKCGDKTFKQIKAIQTVASEYNVKFSCPKDVKPTFELKNLYGKMLEKYDMLPLLSRDNWTYEWNSKLKLTLENYVNVIDVCQQSSNTN